MTVHWVTREAAAEKETDGRYRWRITVGTPDRYGDVIEPGGVRIESYMRNPVVLWAHQSHQLPVGRTLSIGTDGNALLATMEFAEHELAQDVRRLVDGGFLRAASVGFLPLRSEPLPNGGTRYAEVDLVEWSIVPVPAHPEALLADAERAGIVCRALREALLRQEEEDWRVGGATDLELLDDDEWDRDEAEAQVRRLCGGDPADEGFDWSLYRKAHVVYNAAAPNRVGSYKLLFCKVREGRLVASRRGLIACRVVLAGGRGGVDLPEEVIERAKEFVDRYLGGETEHVTRAGAVLSRVNRERLESARSHIQAAAAAVDEVLASAERPQDPPTDGPGDVAADAGSRGAHTLTLGGAEMQEQVQRPAGLEVITRSARLEDQMEPGIRAVRCLKAALLAYSHPGMTVAQAAELMYPQDKLLVKTMLESSAGAGGVLVPEEFSREVIAALYDKGTVRRAGARVLPMRTDVLHIPRQTAGLTASYTAEGADIGKTTGTFDEIVLTTKRLTALVAVSNDLLRDASIEADRFVRDDLVAALAQREDAAFIRDDGTANKPRGIRYATNPSNVFAANPTINDANIISDLYTAVSRVLQGLKQTVLAPGWLMATRTLVALAKRRDSAGWVFPELRQDPPVLLGYPVYVTDQIPTNLGVGADETEVYFVDFGQCIIGERDQVEITASGEAAFVDGGSLVSAFSRNLTVLRAIARHDFALRLDTAAAVITAVKWQ